jgi:hypothetical protein
MIKFIHWINHKAGMTTFTLECPNLLSLLRYIGGEEGLVYWDRDYPKLSFNVDNYSKIIGYKWLHNQINFINPAIQLDRVSIYYHPGFSQMGYGFRDPCWLRGSTTSAMPPSAYFTDMGLS